MRSNKLVLVAAAVASALGLSACSDGDRSSLTIEGDTINEAPNNPTNPGNGVSTCPSFATSRPQTSTGTNVCQLPSSISSSTILTADTIWYLADRVTVGNGNGEMSATPGTLANGLAVQNVTLTIEAGTQIKAQVGTFANIIITRGSKIMAEGTASAPIVFSSEDDNYDGTGEWGGLIIHGYAQHNTCGTVSSVACNVDAEGESGFAGGYNNADNSGSLRYVVVAEGGYEFAPGNEINGISFVGVGSGTVVDYIQVHNNKDDAIEMYGGTVNMKHLVLTNNLDDTIDWDEGYQGNIQYAIVNQAGANTDGNAVEADTDGSTTSPMLSKPTLANFTFLVNTVDANATALNLKARTGGFFHNGIITLRPSSTVTSCVVVSGSGAQANRNVSMYFDNVIVNCGAGGAFGDAVLNQTTVFAVDPALAANYTTAVAQATLGANYDWAGFKAAHTESLADTTFLEANNFLGAVNPNGSNLWYQGWTLPGSL
ncbi:hypothetical protein [Peristeroidobacter agariperforans]|uniref:hypothetical protein n=1 Tax=Peristeroidobacter agariperforans TaxID=268404 RepID=UPI00101D8FB7|nr:hypothetical protein [Peristeroidobacter agariperforans]